MLFAHSPSHLQSLIDRFSRICIVFMTYKLKKLTLTYKLKKKTNVLAQETASPNISINYHSKLLNEFTYLESTISRKLSFDKDVDRRTGKAAFTLARLGTRV